MEDTAVDRKSLDISDITVVSVCYNSGEVIGEMVASIPEDVPVILVDNEARTQFPDFGPRQNVKIIPLAENVGFGRGCNEGAKAAQTPYLLFLNPDSRLEDGTLNALLNGARHHPEASAFNPRLQNAKGDVAFKRRSYLLPRSEYIRRGWPDADFEVPVLSGSAIFVSKANFDIVGGFDPEIFLYHEDDDLSLRLKKLGPLYFIRDAVVTHAGGHSSGRSAKVAYLKAYHMARSRVYTGRKYDRPAPLFFAYLEAFRLMASPITWFSARKRAKAAGFLAGARSVSG
ncbi:glycosyltransferase family 2 protein [Rhizobium sp. L1K21]|uniref:glycosyltransferase family 2 protein n=1 Tax=Rhizobium sp. L1K21 TaxID=2954933 RepID=UPI0020933B04|nr:glycosyltransferase family 2 protein [Rhizobium sp. L1K21]MCO6186619.1 glycosyltransferase family 2 protein [Rhizobium sp. L1K21]